MTCKNCTYWNIKTPPAIGECNKKSKTTLFNYTCKDFKDKNTTQDDFITDFFKKSIFKGK